MFAAINWTPEAITAASTVALAFLTCVLAIGTLFLWLATKRLVKETEQKARRQLRAYVHVSDATILHANSEWSPNVRVKFKNYGQTPAYMVSNRCCHTMRLIGEPVFSLPETIARYSDLGPSQDQTTTMIIPLSLWKQLLKPAIEGRATSLFVFGQITYFDAFQDRAKAPHMTNYRFRIPVDDEGVTDGCLDFSDEGNSSD